VAHIGRILLSSVQHAPSTHYQPQRGRGTDCPARWCAPIKSRRRRSLPLVQLLWRRPQRCMNKSATSSLLGASATRLTRFANHAQTRTMRAQQSVTMIDTMGLRVKAQTPAAQRMARKSFPLAPSCRRGRRQPSKGSGQSRMPHIAARPAPLQRPATSPDAPLRKGSKLAFNRAPCWPCPTACE